MISYRRVQEKKATNYCIRFGHSLRSAISCRRKWLTQNDQSVSNETKKGRTCRIKVMDTLCVVRLTLSFDEYFMKFLEFPRCTRRKGRFVRGYHRWILIIQPRFDGNTCKEFFRKIDLELSDSKIFFYIIFCVFYSSRNLIILSRYGKEVSWLFDTEDARLLTATL